MDNEWILDVIADMRTFARQNGLAVLAEQLDDTWVLAASEITSPVKGTLDHERGSAPTVRNNPKVSRSGLAI